jgi:hypothetical protein
MMALQGYTPEMLVHESRIFQVTIFGTLQNIMNALDFSLLLPDVMIIADEVDAQLTQSMRSYMKLMKSTAAQVSARTTALPRGNCEWRRGDMGCCGVPLMGGASVIFQDPTPAAYYDEPEQAECRSTKRKKVSNSWPPPECLSLIFKRKLEDEN